MVSSVIPPNGAKILNDAPVSVTFDESMDPGAPGLTGTMASEAASAWSTVSVADDHLSITPTTTWSVAPHTLTLDVADASGNPLSVLLGYTVASSCDDSNRCTIDTVEAARYCTYANVPNGSTVTSCYTGPIGTQGVGVCRGGTISCTAGVESCAGEVLPGPELAGNGLDDNCNGAADE